MFPIFTSCSVVFKLGIFDCSVITVPEDCTTITFSCVVDENNATGNEIVTTTEQPTTEEPTTEEPTTVPFEPTEIDIVMIGDMLMQGVVENLLAGGEHQRAHHSAHAIAYTRKAS